MLEKKKKKSIIFSMSCTSPRLAVKLPSQKKLKFLGRVVDNIETAERIYGKENVFLIPCGSCSACVLAKRKEWSIRCAMESIYHKDNCFLTLTYDDDHVPEKLQKSHLQEFIQNLRNLFKQSNQRIRYFCCGEYGENTLRPHYHCIIFGYRPEDARYYCKSKSGNAIFTSEEINKLWSKGNCIVQDFTANTAGYVAGYVNKKFDKNDGFLMMSTRPGLGAQYLEDHASEILKYGVITDDFGKFKNVAAPRYFEAIAKRLGLEKELENLKLDRRDDIDYLTIEKMRLHSLKYKEQVIKLDEQVNNRKLAKLKRSL